MKTKYDNILTSFVDKNEFVRINYMKNFYFDVSKEELNNIGAFEINNKEIFFDVSEKRVTNKMNIVLQKGLLNLTHKIRNKKTLLVNRELGLPLIGTNEFGLIDRGSNIIEVKPITGCNLSCIFCSVDEGINDKKDVVVDVDYLIEEFENLASIKKNPIEANIGPQGEPLLYPYLLELISGLKLIKNVDVISINTNGLTLNPKLIDDLAACGLTRINLSLHALDKELATELAAGPYNLDHILKMIKYCQGKIDVLLAPVLIPGHNENELDAIIELSKTIKNKKYPSIGIQNYLNYKGGRNITKEMSWDDFNSLLKQKEIEHKVKLFVDQSVFNILPDESLPKPFRKGQIIDVNIICQGRKNNEYLGESNNRTITVIKPKKTKGIVKAKLIRDKHNIFTAIGI